jgi:4-alpha-glucanotransferase
VGSAAPDALEALAHEWGVETSYESVDGDRIAAEPETVVAVLAALGAPITSVADAPDALAARVQEQAARLVAPVMVSWDDGPTMLTLNLPTDLELDAIRIELSGADGQPSAWNGGALTWAHGRSGHDTRVSVTAALPVFLDPGYYRAAISTGAERVETTIIRAPVRAPSLIPTARRGWGVFAPTYALRGAASTGAVGTLTDLDELAGWAHGRGATVISTLPLLAAFLDEPCDPSPYSPVSLRFWNEMIIDPARVPELDGLAAPSDAIERLRREPLIDWRAAAAAQRELLEAGLARLLERGGDRAKAFDEFCGATLDLAAYSAFRAAVEEHGADRSAWPASLQAGPVDERSVDPGRSMYHEYAQWLAEQQMAELATALGARGQCLALDLPVGCNPNGFDVWRAPEAFVESASVGAPPDEFFSHGQDWGFRPTHPEGRRTGDYQELRRVLAHHLRHAGALRIDHVMGLHRLWMIPSGHPANEGAYVRYPADELAAVIGLEAHRFNAAIVAENLGTVPRAVGEMLDRHGWLGMFVAEFELDATTPEVVAEPAASVVASIGTHDTATFGAFWSGSDIEDRERLGAIDATQAAEERSGRAVVRAALAARLGVIGDPAELAEDDATATAVMTMLLEDLGRSGAELLLVSLEDLWLERRPQNVPGVGPEDYPSWSRRTARPLADVADDADIAALLARVDTARRNAKESLC